MTKLIVRGMKVPEPTPAKASSTRKPVRFVVSGASSEARKKTMIPVSRTRRAPKTAPR